MKYANHMTDYKFWDYINGDLNNNPGLNRLDHLNSLVRLSKYKLKLSVRDPETNEWTKWGLDYSHKNLLEAYDIHRSLLANEILIESDYPTYEENYEATKLIGAILEQKGFSPIYYWSGNKSVHIHVYFDFSSIFNVPNELQDRVIARFRYKSGFIKKFIEWLREKMISCWGLNAREFDRALIKSTHLIRAEGSRNKIGFKTFLGYTHKDVSFIPNICNENNKRVFEIGEIRMSSPNNPEDLLEEFLFDIELKKKKARAKPREANLMDFENGGTVRPQIQYLLSDDFKGISDGTRRLLFILINELKRVYTPIEAGSIARNWNNRLGNPVPESYIEYRLNTKTYTFSNEYINSFFKEVGIDY